MQALQMGPVIVSSKGHERLTFECDGFPSWDGIIARLELLWGPGCLCIADGKQLPYSRSSTDNTEPGEYEWLTPTGEILRNHF